MQILDERFAKDWFIHKVDAAFTFRTFQVLPPRVLTGRVTAADTGEPIRECHRPDRDGRGR